MTDLHEILDEHERDPRKNHLAYDNETVIWDSRPSQWVNIGTFIFWGISILLSAIFLIRWKTGLNEDYTELVNTAVVWISWAMIIISMLNILLPYLRTRYERTVITLNKIKESSGITKLFQVDKFAEISDIKDISSPAAGILSIVGLSNLIIHTNDPDQPIIQIRGIRDRDKLIAKLLPIWRELKIERKGYFGGQSFEN